VKDVRTRWNSAWAMIGRALKLKAAINQFVTEEPEASHLALDASDWKLLAEISVMLKVFDDCTKIVSHHSVPQSERPSQATAASASLSKPSLTTHLRKSFKMPCRSPGTSSTSIITRPSSPPRTLSPPFSIHISRRLTGTNSSGQTS
ncbi:hypothetical protein BDK51DRAFT_24982, partial [Blyttiomyces helicus]